MSTKTGARGTAGMSPETRKSVASKGGQAISRNRAHMAEIGRKGGSSVAKDREHMAKIGRRGGSASRKKAQPSETPVSSGTDSIGDYMSNEAIRKPSDRGDS